ncbi:unnamed protein product [Phytophthora lilii]|uniref:Unnamed protein product n=1 Tax=Phytophthora lilii TaxID=2077276 RepID=A0A9W6UFF1_9STRA|nr:unnamed protein product [Phytophthora lilii]
MYEGASWATDISNGITTVAKKSTELTQTDSSESAEALRKTLSDANAQTNPETHPTTSDVGVDNSARMVDASVDVRPSTTDTETNTTKSDNLDTEEQVSSREWIKCFYKNIPTELLSEFNVFERKQVVKTRATESKIRDIWYEGESQSIDEVGSMRDEENRTRTVMRLGKKRSGHELKELDVVLKDRRLPNITFDKKITATTSDDERSRFKMLWIISKNMEMLESNGLIKSIIPVFKDKYKSDKSSLEQYVWVKDGSVDVFGKESNLNHTTALKKIEWQSTLREF